MTRRTVHLHLVRCATTTLLLTTRLILATDPRPARVEFNRQIRPILSENCFKCHGPDEKARDGRVRLDVREAAVAQHKERGPAIVPGDPAKSLMFQRITTADSDERMPPAETGKSLSGAQIDLIHRWIEQGATWERHWSFLPPKRPAIPAVTDVKVQCNSPIDSFILDRLRSSALKPATLADSITLVRRVYFDLVGLPPTPADVDRYVADPSPDAYARLVDQLLASPRFGERMAVYWLDLVRYADTVGYHGDQERTIWPYRDYVIDAFNQNLPFDRFTIEQIAGDLLPNATIEQRIASGYNMLGMTTIEGGAQAKEYLAKYAADRVRATAGAWLAGTLGCAECHDHKYDPFTTRDFYSFAALFADIVQPGVGNPEPNLFLPTSVQAAQLAVLDKELADLKAWPAKTDADRKTLDAKSKKIKARRTELEKQVRQTIVPVSGNPRVTRVLPRGNWLDESGPIVTASIPEFLKSTPHSPHSTLHSPLSTRLQLAHWLAARENPLTARVFVNRLWKLYFGTGLSRVLDDLGSQGEWPTHPELLDWLAVEFMDSGWNVKHMVRLLVTSRAYRQSSLESAEQRMLDPGNRLLSRQSRFRLPAELIRDNQLAISGLLVERIGGPSVRPYQPAGYYRYLNFPTRDYYPSIGADQCRRGVYTHWQRTFLHPAMIAFDAPSREECCADRPVSNTPLAALVQLNDPTAIESARALAERAMREGGPSDTSRIVWIWRRAVARQPTQVELKLLAGLLQKHRAEFAQDPKGARQLLSTGQRPYSDTFGPAELAAWSSVTHTVLVLDETITRY